MGENKNLVYILIGVIVVLLAVAGFMVYRNFTAVPDVNTTAGTTGTGTGTGSTGTGGSTGIEPAAFDAKTATRLQGATPEDHVKAYHEAVIAKTWDAAYKLLPLTGKAGQQNYGDAAAFGKQLAGYGITGYEVSKPVTSGNVTTVDAKLMMPMMPQGITYKWTFKKVDGVWYCVDRASSM